MTSSLPVFDFDQPADRRATGSSKWDKYAGRDILPLWVADMDFRSPPCVTAALHARVDHGIFGYTDPTDELAQTLIAHLEDQYRWQIKKEWIVWLPGLVTGLNLAARAFCDPGQQAITATPVYPPFLSAPLNQGREVLRVPMALNGNRWAWDMDQLDSMLTPQTSMLSLCNPHNPVGRVFTQDELHDLASRCARHKLVLCSDEIHCGLILDASKKHIPIASLSPEICASTVTLMAPSKTFNLPGLGCAFAIVSNAQLRARMKRAAAGVVPRVNALGFTAAQAAYGDGEPWRAALLAYLRGNRDLVLEAIGTMPGLRVFPMEATYLAWIDARALGQPNPTKFFEEAGVGLSDGAEFGAPGYVRLNFGCTRTLLRQGLARMASAIAKLKISG
ncbi:MAG: MalY/PatB family protein [Burkholderiales bacterium]